MTAPWRCRKGEEAGWIGAFKDAVCLGMVCSSFSQGSVILGRRGAK